MSTPNPAAAAAPAPRKGKKMMVIGGLFVLIVAGAAFMFLSKQSSAESEEAQAVAAVPTFLPLENMVVNLADPGGERFAQIGITLELQDEKTALQVKQFMPSIRNSVLMLVSQRSSEELLNREGKEKLAADILAEVSRPLGVRPPRKPAADDDFEYEEERPRRRNPVRRVLFSSFIIQ